MARARFHLTFPAHLIEEPVIYRVSREFDLVTNITRANVEAGSGWVILQVDGDPGAVARAAAWLAERGVRVERLDEAGA
jgi:ABC-type methionine transport system ATPase subunit